ncbi:hypothetical protein MTP99_009141 [Tenebrio molitor]|nr:hypothetical protein MTP99_009141 [Tenebrio molitor]
MWFYKTHSQSAISIAATQPSVSQATAHKKRHAFLQFSLHPGNHRRVSRQLHHRKKACSSAICTAPRKPWASQPTASSQKKDMLLYDFHHEAFGEPADSFITKKRQRLLQELSDQRHDLERVPSLRHHQRSSITDEVQNKTENQPIALLQVELVSSKMVSENQKNFTATCEPTNPSRSFITSGMLAQDWPTN